MSQQADQVRDRRRHSALPGSALDRTVRLLAVVLPALVGAVAATMLIVLRLLALSPWLALHTRLPLIAALAGAAAAIGYTVLTGSQVPTIRSCVAALLVLVALGRTFAGLWFVVLGGVPAGLIAAGVGSPLGVPGVDFANFLGYVLWSVWLLAFAGLLLLRRRPARVTA